MLRRVRKFAKASITFIMSVRIEQLGSQWIDFMKFYVWVFIEICQENLWFIRVWQE